MVRIGEAAALEIRRKMVRWMESASLVCVAQPSLASIGARQPTEEVVERAVLHHDDDDVLDARFIWGRQLLVIVFAIARSEQRLGARSERSRAG